MKLVVDRLLDEVRLPSHYGTVEEVRLQSIVISSENKHIVFMSIQTTGTLFLPVGPHYRH